MLSKKESPELKQVNQVTKDYNFHNQSKSPEVTKVLIPQT